MGEGQNSYVAWDGQRYEGLPPTGWFLAADNRWWPAADLIEPSPVPVEHSEDRPQTETWDERSDPFEGRNPPEPPAANPDAPRSGVPDPLHPPPGNHTSNRPFQLGRRGARRVVQVLVFVFIFRSCIGSSDVEVATDEVSPATYESAAPADYEVTIDACTGSIPAGEIRNNTNRTLRFVVTLDLSFGIEPPDQRASAPTLPAAPGALVNWRTPLPEGSPLVTGCDVFSVESSQAG